MVNIIELSWDESEGSNVRTSCCDKQNNRTDTSWTVNHRKYRFFMAKLMDRLIIAMTRKNEIIKPVINE